MGAASIQQMADRVAGLMEERLKIGGQGLAAKVKKGGRMMPRKVRDAGQRLAQAAMMAQNPKLLMQVDEERVAEDYDTCLKHLSGINVWARRKGGLLNMATSILGSLLIVGGLLVAVLYWRGFL